jgi:hypothetical protein
MADRVFDAILYCRTPPDISFEGGMFHVAYAIGKVHAEFVLTPNTFLKALRAANRVADEFHEGTGKVEALRRH